MEQKSSFSFEPLSTLFLSKDITELIVKESEKRRDRHPSLNRSQKRLQGVCGVPGQLLPCFHVAERKRGKGTVAKLAVPAQSLCPACPVDPPAHPLFQVGRICTCTHVSRPVCPCVRLGTRCLRGPISTVAYNMVPMRLRLQVRSLV